MPRYAAAALPLILAACFAAAPAAADVKAGVDAWGRGDYSRAVAEWRPLAIAGDADAQFNLAQAYKLGRGVPVDPPQALEWFRKAADKGHLQAQDNYGIGLFQAGRRTEALPYLERASTRGEARAQLVLGTMLFNGDGVATDYPRAYALMTRASQAGLPSAAQTLAQMDGFISATDRQRGLQLAQQYAQTAVQTPAQPNPAQPRPAQSSLAQPSPSQPYRIADRPVPTQAGRTPPPIRTAAIPPSRAVPEPHPAPAARPAPRPATAPARGGNWRVQLGAFRDRANAESLWSRVGSRVGGSPAYVAAGGVVRLQATGFASRADAQRACTRAGTTCLVVAP